MYRDHGRGAARRRARERAVHQRRPGSVRVMRVEPTISMKTIVTCSVVRAGDGAIAA
jgi:hypothetical protein